MPFTAIRSRARMTGNLTGLISRLTRPLKLGFSIFSNQTLLTTCQLVSQPKSMQSVGILGACQ